MTTYFVSEWLEVFRQLTAAQQKKRKKMIRKFMAQKGAASILSLPKRPLRAEDFSRAWKLAFEALEHAWETRSGPFSGIK